ncbi:hypothetical protein NFI96_009144 [Prochilodus magdalenae]|nr:hypothetical protein NFI96_009144 [Prochilodus magdalenae]
MGTKNFIIFFCCVVWVTGHEYYSSTDQIASLIAKEEELLESFTEYIEEEEAYLWRLRSVLLDLKLLKVSQRKDLEINNPLAAYKLMKRVRAEWATIFKYTKLSPSQVYQKLLEEDLQQLPDQDDLDEAAHGIIKLQETYKLYPQNITTDPLTASISLTCLSKIKKGEEEDEDMDEDADLIKATVFNYLSLSAFKFGNLPFAIHFSQQLVNLGLKDTENRFTPD